MTEQSHFLGADSWINSKPPQIVFENAFTASYSSTLMLPEVAQLLKAPQDGLDLIFKCQVHCEVFLSDMFYCDKEINQIYDQGVAMFTSVHVCGFL